ncbi:ABC transporter permease [Azospirillum sp. YIM DDC1]|uniref:Peptide/nickel transport system permease protein n=3 Tax=Azospirillum TaxID=191 RepID=A0A560BK50_AZOBR|nr:MULTISPECIES: ABC transporter permease [Azospirillum]AWJ93659.1 ABC transporter permease [Azospirillum baldaniorum]MBK3734918.1 ABC transporter permease subunit [Azospirillum brasilense]MBK3774732.1 ABC transporter permease subunit [Azospirillum brasilense]MBK3803186.1 ABC transporter permease subunit [Azospirillum argentinense]MBK4721392.1 ABC transporter permease [Azospirillum aestuarii]
MDRLLRQLSQLAITVFGIVTVTFFLVRMIPGDPAQYMLGDYATEEALATLRAQLGLDQPVYVQYGLYVLRAVTGDFGSSVVTGRPALEEILFSLPDSAILAFAGLAVAVAIGIPLGILTAERQGSWSDMLIMIVALFGISFPVFWLGLASVLLFSQELKWFPALGASSGGGFLTHLHHLVLPAGVLGISVAAYITRLTRSAMLEVLGQDCIRVARAMGVPERRVVWRLALKNALVPILAIVGVTFAWSLGSAILIEVVFSRPGIGSMILKAVSARDYQLVQAGVLVLAVAVVLVNSLLDLAYGLVDPRLSTR